METPTPTLREQGIQALREGNLDGAIDFLARAVMADGQDAEAQAFLGVAYSQKGLHAQATRALQTAITLQPQEARYQFNLGVALESSGDAQGAATAYRETLRLNPEHAQARTRLEGLGAGTGASFAAPTAPAAPTSAPAADPSWLGSQPPPGATATAAPSTAGANWMAGQQPGSLAAPQTGPPGTVQCPSCKQWSKPGMSCEWCSSPLKAPSPAGTAPWLQSSGTTSDAMTDYGYSSAPDMTAGEAFGRRFAAFFIDGIVVNVLGFIAGLAVGLSATAAAGVSESPFSGTQLTATLLGMLLGFAYYVGLTSWRGQTLGKMALGIRVVGPEGGNPAFWRAAVRETIGRLLSSILLLGYLWMLWDANQQTWHDKIAGTTVEKA